MWCRKLGSQAMKDFPCPDKVKAFFSGLMTEVRHLLSFHRINTTAYHPQTNGLVERFNRTFISMLAKTAEQEGRDWDQHLSYVLFAYRASAQQSTQESPFFLLYGRDPRLPTEAALTPEKTCAQVDLKEFGVDLVDRMSHAWNLAKTCVKKAQGRQKRYYDQRARPPTQGERVFLFKPAEKSGETRKLARPFDGPYRVVAITDSTASICRVDKPQEEPILVSLSRLRRCPEEI